VFIAPRFAALGSFSDEDGRDAEGFGCFGVVGDHQTNF